MIWDLIVFGFVIMIAIWLFKMAWYIFLTVVVMVAGLVGWIIEKVKGE